MVDAPWDVIKMQDVCVYKEKKSRVNLIMVVERRAPADLGLRGQTEADGIHYRL